MYFYGGNEDETTYFPIHLNVGEWIAGKDLREIIFELTLKDTGCFIWTFKKRKQQEPEGIH